MKIATFINHFRCRLRNNFLLTSEWWEVFQLYECGQEIFELKLHKSRDQKKIWVEEFRSNGEKKEIECLIEHEDFDNKILYRVHLPLSKLPVKYRVHWEF